MKWTPLNLSYCSLSRSRIECPHFISYFSLLPLSIITRQFPRSHSHTSINQIPISINTSPKKINKMVIPENSPLESTEMSKLMFSRHKTSSFFSDGFMFLGGALVALLLVWTLWSFTTPPPSTPNITLEPDPPTRPDPTTFYDDPDLSYWIQNPVRNWDDKRRQWLNRFPSFSGSGERVLMITGSQPSPCKSPTGDHLLLRLFKNKVDYCRIHGCDVFYNNVLLHPKMFGYWAKYAAIRAAMVAHPESEWIWWVDSDAAITDMDFTLPLEKYKPYNLVIHGWATEIYEKRSWTGLNAGVFLIRNCQWSMDLMDRWIKFGPQSPDYEKLGRVQREKFPDKMFPESDDQTAMAYILVEEKNKWGDKIFLENDYYFEGYWVEIVEKLENVTKRYKEIEQRVRRLRRRHAEKGGEGYRAQWGEYLKEVDTGGYGLGSWKRPFVTHFTGCEPCSGEHNDMYTWHECFDGMVKTLNFADDQVLRNFGFFRPDLMNSSLVLPLKVR